MQKDYRKALDSFAITVVSAFWERFCWFFIYCEVYISILIFCNFLKMFFSYFFSPSLIRFVRAEREWLNGFVGWRDEIPCTQWYSFHYWSSFQERQALQIGCESILFFYRNQFSNTLHAIVRFGSWIDGKLFFIVVHLFFRYQGNHLSASIELSKMIKVSWFDISLVLFATRL